LFSSKKKLTQKQDHDECLGQGTGNNCAEDIATCTNTIGSFTCACKTGYSGDGVTCNGNDSTFI